MTDNKSSKKNAILTIPNLLSFTRILLIPLIVWFYVGLKNIALAAVALAASALSDIIDGPIARKFNQVSEFGKLLDPIADKFTQAALLFCIVVRFRLVLLLLLIFVLKEATMVVFGAICLEKTSEFSSARWYGKANTVLLEIVICVLLFIPGIPAALANALIIMCMVSVVSSLILYISYYLKLFSQAQDAKTGEVHK